MWWAEYVYALIDPRSELPFYIGRSGWPETRIYRHFSNAANPLVKARVDEIRAAGMEPSWGILEKTEDGRTAECKWVQRCLAKGIPLTNSFKLNRYRADPDDQPVEAITLVHEKAKVPTIKYRAGEKSQVVINGIPVEYVSQMKTVANSLPPPQQTRLKRAYAEAIESLLDSTDRPSGDTQLPIPTDGNTQKIVWIPTELYKRLDAHCESMTFKSSFIITAISRYLKSKGE